MNLVRFNHPGFTNFFDHLEKTHHGLNNGYKGNVPSVNIIENEKTFVLEVVAPGVKKDDFKIDLDNQTLTVSREIEETKEDTKVNYTRKEFVYGNFSRSFTLPKSIKFDGIAADYNEGILSITLPKKDEEAKLTRKITIA
ncbi:MAG: Hsp20/alpha crystallin family protein [Bacteroidota bacterium]